MSQPITLDDGSTHTEEAIADAGECCLQGMCPSAYEERRLRQAQYSLTAKVEDLLTQVRDMADDERISKEVAAELRQELRDALGLG